jgi:transcriptional regulator with XRE-family HTH domain
MKTKLAIARALREVRKARKLSQEDFWERSSRAYVSLLERGQKSPTLEKIEALSETMRVHPMTLLTLAYVKTGTFGNIDDLFSVVRQEVQEIAAATS